MGWVIYKHCSFWLSYVWILKFVVLDTQIIEIQSGYCNNYNTQIALMNLTRPYVRQCPPLLPLLWWRDLFMCNTVHIRSYNVKSHWKVQGRYFGLGSCRGHMKKDPNLRVTSPLPRCQTQFRTWIGFGITEVGAAVHDLQSSHCFWLGVNKNHWVNCLWTHHSQM